MLTKICYSGLLRESTSTAVAQETDALAGDLMKDNSDCDLLEREPLLVGGGDCRMME